MTQPFQFGIDARVRADGTVSRRGFLRAAGLGATALGLGGHLVARADDARRRGMACIVLWMGGGPSQFESFDPKPGTDTGGPTKTIRTAASGVHIAEGWERVAGVLSDVAVIRSMTHTDGEHERATYYSHTGYTPTPAIAYPTLGSVAASEVGPVGFDLPHFIRVNRSALGLGGGFLGTTVAPFDVADPTRLPANVAPPAGLTPDRFSRRLGLAGKLAAEQTTADKPLGDEHRALYARADRLIRSPLLSAFDVSKEPDKLRDAYGRNPFGQGCLLARRLVEAGVTFVEVACGHPEAPAAWDTHIDNFAVTRKLVDRADPGFAALLTDLKDRGMLDRTLVVWMGEFGRTPKINDRGKTGGRDHYPRAYSAALAGAGVRGGRVIGATDPKGVNVTDRPVRVPDLLATICDRLGIDYRKKHTAPGDVPVGFVDHGKPVLELWG